MTPTPRCCTLSPEAHCDVTDGLVWITNGDLVIILPLNLEVELFPILELRAARRKAAYNDTDSITRAARSSRAQREMAS